MATLVRWEPFRELATLQNEMSRFMNGMLDGPGRTTQSWVPPLDVWETESEVVYAFDLPGVPEGSITIEVQDSTLTVGAEREQVARESDEHYHRFERRFGTFTRTVGLPQGVDESKIGASYRDGVLEVRVPKPEEAKPRRIPVGSAGAQDVEGTASAS